MFENEGSSEGTSEVSESVESSGDDTATTVKDAKAAPVVESDEVEISLGNVKGKVSKAMAEALKGFEKAARTKIQESSELKKKWDAAKADPRQFFKEHDMDPEEWAEMTLAEKLKEMQKSPEERERDELKKYKETHEEKERRQKEDAEKEEATKAESEAMQSLDNEILEAFQNSGLPKKAMFVRMIAGDMHAAAKRGEDLTAKAAASKIKQDLQNDFRGLASEIDVDTFVKEYLSEDVLKKIREFELRRVTGKSASTQSSSGQSNGTGAKTSHPGTPKKESKPMNEREFIRRFGAAE